MAISHWKRTAVKCFRDTDDHHILAYAAAMSYYFVLALFPALIALAATVAYLPIPNMFSIIVSSLARVMPPESMVLVQTIVADIITPNPGPLLSVGLLGTLWSVSGGFANMIEALNIACDVQESRPIWKTRLLALGLTLLIGGLIEVAFCCILVGPHFGELLAANFGLSRVFAVLWPMLRYFCALMFLLLAIVGIYRIAPNTSYTLKQVLPGAGFAVLTWLLLSSALSFYFRNLANLNRTYGALGGCIALLLWLYWTAFLILLGAELNSELVQVSADSKFGIDPRAGPPLLGKRFPF